MKLLIFEYITGGGFSSQSLPASLRAEGELMLRAMLADCKRIASIEVQLILDGRCANIADGYTVDVTMVNQGEDVQPVFMHLLEAVDAVWLVAPEFSGILQTLTTLAENAGTCLLTSSSTAVALTADKWRTFQCLVAAAIPTIDTALLVDFMAYQSGQWVIKPIDGVGCTDTWLVSSVDEFASALALITQPELFIIQPYNAGRTLSLSCIFQEGQGYLLCVNEQALTVQSCQFKLQACKVNCQPVTPELEDLVQRIALTFPGLRGYVGIDLIQSPSTTNEYRVVEINPRLTSSYVGIYTALGVNVAEQVLNLEQHPPVLKPTHSQRVSVNLC